MLSYLIVDDDPVFASALERGIERRGDRAKAATSASQALELAQNPEYQRIVLDLKIGEDSGLQLLPRLKAALPHAEIVLLTGYSSISTAVDAIKLGAVHYLCKPASVEEIVQAFGDTDRTQRQAPELPAGPPSVERLEWEHIQRVLTEHQGNISATARALGMHRRTLQRKLGKRPVQR